MDVRNRRSADTSSDHHLLVAVVRLKLAAIGSTASEIEKYRYLCKVYRSFENDYRDTQRSSWQDIKNSFIEPARYIIGYAEKKTRKQWSTYFSYK